MCWRLLLCSLSFIVIKGDLINQNLPPFTDDSGLNQENVERKLRSFIYANADSFSKNNLDPTSYYRPLPKIHINVPIYGAAITASAQRLYQLKGGLYPFPYMLPVSNDIVSHVTDPVYQNKLHGSASWQRDEEGVLSALCEGRTGQAPSPRSCGSYVNCWRGGVAAEQHCPEGLLFSVAGYCDYAHRVACGQRPITSEMADCSEEYSVVRDADSCGGFAVCVGGQRVRFECPAGLHYSERLGVCDYPYRVHCNVSSKGSGQPPPPQPAPEPLEGAPAALVSVPAKPDRVSPSGNAAGLEGQEYVPPPPPEQQVSPGEDILYDNPVRMSPYVATSHQHALWQIEGARQHRNRLSAPPYFSHF